MPRLDKTLADYIAIAVSPVLIMLMVGSLMYFLASVCYAGRYDTRVYWILACYTVAIVLITRISMEDGQDRAAVFGLALAMAVALAVMRFSNAWFPLWILLGVVWWSAHKLTWDCTLIDEDQDSSGQGLLQLVRFRKKTPAGAKPSPEEAATESPEQKESPPEGVTERVSEMRAGLHRRRGPKGKTHAPGVWIVYFSLAALPLFGLGQRFIPAGNLPARRWAFQLLCVYVASGLGLLVTTSFLGLRRYLRQRNVEMPTDMARVWTALGAAVIVVLLAVVALLPRPAAEYAVAEFPLRFTTPQRESSSLAVGKDGADRNADDSRPGVQENQEQEAAKQDQTTQGQEPPSDSEGDTQADEKQPESADSPDREQGGRSDRSGSSSGDQGGASKQSDEKSNEQAQSNKQGKRESGEPKQGREPSDRDGQEEPSTERPEQASSDSKGSRQGSRERRQESQKTGEESQPTEQEKKDEKDSDSTRSRGRSSQPVRQPQPPRGPSFQLPSVSTSLGGLFKLLLYALFFGIVGYWLWKSRDRVWAAIQQFLQELREFWARLFGRHEQLDEQTAEDEASEATRLRPFSDYADPFASGLAGQSPPDHVVRYTFEALEAWAREHGCPRDPGQTPREFAQQIGGRADTLSVGAKTLADLYCQVAYASGHLTPDSIRSLARFWQRLSTLAKSQREELVERQLP